VHQCKWSTSIVQQKKKKIMRGYGTSIIEQTKGGPRKLQQAVHA